jgi:hypothetical protein
MLPRRTLAIDLGLVFFLAFAIRLVWVALIPPWVTPDEPAHFTYVSHLVEHGEIPRTVSSPLPEYSEEVEESAARVHSVGLSWLGNVVGQKVATIPTPFDYVSARNQNGSPEQRQSAAGASATAYPPVYYAWASIPYRLLYSAPVLSRLYGVRISSALLGALSCCFAYLFALELAQRRDWALSVAITAGLVPMHAFITASVNNDAALVLVSSALCWWIARCTMGTHLTWNRIIWLGVLSGSVLVTKQTAFSLAIAATGLIVVRTFPVRIRPWRFDAQRALKMTTFLACFSAIELPWWLYRTLTASSSGSASTEAVVAKRFFAASHTLGAYVAVQASRGWDYYKWLFIRTYWACFGWLEVMLSEWIYTTIAVLYTVASLAVMLRCWRKAYERRALLLSLGLVVLHVLFMFFIVDYAISFAVSGAGLGLQGRYFFVTMVPLLFLLVAGLSTLSRDRVAMSRLLPLGAGVLQVASLATMLSRYYGINFG